MEVQDAVASTLATPFAQPIIAAPKTRAQIQREYRQRIAASRNPAQAAAAREARNVRDRNNRLRQAANLAIASGSLEATTISSSPSGEESNNVQTRSQRQHAQQQSTPTADQPDERVNLTNEPLFPAIPVPMEVQEADASTSATPFAKPITAAPKTSAQIQREYRQRIAASRTPAQAAAAREARNVRDRNNRLRQATNLAIASGSLEATTISSSPSGEESNNVQTRSQRQHAQQQSTTTADQPDERVNLTNEPLFPAIPVPMEVQVAVASTSATPFAKPITAAPKTSAQILQMGKSRAEYMRDYRQKKREEKLKTEPVELIKRIPRNSTQRTRDFRARQQQQMKNDLQTSYNEYPETNSQYPNIKIKYQETTAYEYQDTNYEHQGSNDSELIMLVKSEKDHQTTNNWYPEINNQHQDIEMEYQETITNDYYDGNIERQACNESIRNLETNIMYPDIKIEYEETTNSDCQYENNEHRVINEYISGSEIIPMLESENKHQATNKGNLETNIMYPDIKIEYEETTTNDCQDKNDEHQAIIEYTSDSGQQPRKNNESKASSRKRTSEDAFSKASTSRSSSSENIFENEIKEHLPPILFSKYFEIVKKLDRDMYHPRYRDRILVNCRICKIQLMGSEQMPSNFIRHLRGKHNKEYEEYKGAKTDQILKPSTEQSFNKLVARFTVENMLPISTITSEAFKMLISFANPNLKVMSQPTAVAMIDSTYGSMIQNIKNLIDSNKFFCTTADIWSTKHKSFLWYTIHWIDESLTRQSAAIACKRFSGSHTFERIRDIIIQIHAEYSLNSCNVRATITGNVSNFIKSFEEFGISGVKIAEVDFNDDDEEGEIYFGDVPNILFDSRLPKHIRCATHTLSLVATTDFLHILKQNITLFEKHQKIMQKCSRLWKNVTKPDTSEKLKALLGCELKYPVATRWNSIYDSIKDLLKHKLKVNDVVQIFHEELFTELEFNYLQEYVDLFSPIAEAIDFLQRNPGIVYAFLLPTLARTRIKYVNITANKGNKIYSDLAASVLKALEARFLKYFTLAEDVHDAIVASVVCPQVKTTWISALNPSFGKTKTNEIIKLVKDTVANECGIDSTLQPLSEDETTNAFEANSTSKSSVQQLQSDAEFSVYLADANTTFDMLNKYARLKSTFIKYNAPLPSSAAVERLFSYHGLLMASQRTSLSDSDFEKFVLLKANSFLS